MTLVDEAPGPAPTPKIAVLPPRARLIHVGLPKSGTTSLQRGAAQHRTALLNVGVRYPGTGRNHRDGVRAAIGRIPDRSHWSRLLEEIEAERERRVFLSSEYGVFCTDAHAAEFQEALGDTLHVLVTVRSYAAMLPSNWQQHVKTGGLAPFETWLRSVLADPPTQGLGAQYDLRLDAAGIAARWASLIGPERVIIVVADGTRPTLLLDAVADLLGVPHELLRSDASGHFSSNRSLSWPETETIRALNGIVRVQGVPKSARYNARAYHDAISRLLNMRTPGPEEPPILLPEWAAELASARAADQARALRSGGYCVIGDPSALQAATRVGRNDAIEAVPLDLAVQALGGAVSANARRAAARGRKRSNAASAKRSARRRFGAATKCDHDRKFASRLGRLWRAARSRIGQTRRRSTAQN